MEVERSPRRQRLRPAYMTDGRLGNDSGIQRGSVLRRGHGGLARRFNLGRLCAVSAVCVLLLVTNPMNNVGRHLENLLSQLCGEKIANVLFGRSSSSAPTGGSLMAGPKRRLLGSLKLDFLGIDLDLYTKSKNSKKNRQQEQSSTSGGWISISKTNYLFFSLEETWYGVNLLGLSRNIPLCYSSSLLEEDSVSPEGAICDWIEEHLCHGMTFSKKSKNTGLASSWNDYHGQYNHPFILHRTIAALLVFSFLLHFCSKPTWEGPVASWAVFPYRRPWDVFFSVFHRPRILMDLYLLNTAVFTSLQTLRGDSSLMLLRRSSFSSAEKFYIISILLVVVLGGLSNLLASTITVQGTSGIRGGFAAVLGYQMAVAPNKVLLSALTVYMTATDVLMTCTILGIIELWLLSSYHRGQRKGWFGSGGEVLSWIIGGVVGRALGLYHTGRIHNQAWWSV